MRYFLLIVLVFSISVWANIGKITAVKGEVYIVRDAQTLNGISGFILERNDKITTKDKSKALVLFNDQTMITLGNNTTLAVNEFVMDTATSSNSKTNFGFTKGIFRTITGKIGKINPKGFQIKTKTASIGIRGTVLDTSVRALPNGGELVQVAFLQGHGVITSNISGITTPVNTGQRADMGSDGKVEVKQGALESTKELNDDNKELKEDEGTDETGDTREAGDTGETGAQAEDQGNDTPTESGTAPSETPSVVITTPETIPEAQDIVSNTLPNLSIGSISVSEDIIATIRLSAYDSDGDTLSYSISSNPSNGTVTINAQTGEITYVPNANYFGNESFNVTVSDGTDSVTQTISFTIASVNDLPTISLSSANITLKGTTSASLTYSVSDVEDGSNVTVSAKADNGTVSTENGTFIYTPNSGFIGSDTITITLTDSNGGVNVYTVSVSVDGVSGLILVSVDGSTLTEADVASYTKTVAGSDTYFEYGYYKSDSTTYQAFYVKGDVTPTSVIDSYITNSQTATYQTSLAAIKDTTTYTGSMSLNMNFGSKNFTGTINISTLALGAAIQSGTITNTGFSTTDIVQDGGDYAVTGGGLNGKFYGPNANSVGGQFYLNSISGTIYGVFSGNKE